MDKPIRRVRGAGRLRLPGAVRRAALGGAEHCVRVPFAVRGTVRLVKRMPTALMLVTVLLMPFYRTGRLTDRAGIQSVDDFDRHAECVTHTALRDDVLRLGGVRLDLAPQPEDLHVDRSVVDLCGV